MHQVPEKTDNFELLGVNLPKNGFWCLNLKNLSLDCELASLRYYVYQFREKTNKFKFLGINSPKNKFWSLNFKNVSLDSESASLRFYVHQFPDKRNNFQFFGLNFATKAILVSEFQKSKSRLAISILEILCAPIS